MNAWEERIQLRRDAMRIDRAGSALSSMATGALRVSPQVAACGRACCAATRGADVDLRARYPKVPGLEEQVFALVAKLAGRARCSTTAAPRHLDGRGRPHCRRSGRRGSARVARTPVVAAVVSAACAVAVGLIFLQLAAAPPRLDALLTRFSWLGAGFVVVIAVPLHELAHGTAAPRAPLGMRIAEVGNHVRGCPGYSRASPRHRVVAAAGPIMRSVGQRAAAARRARRRQAPRPRSLPVDPARCACADDAADRRRWRSVARGRARRRAGADARRSGGARASPRAARSCSTASPSPVTSPTES